MLPATSVPEAVVGPEVCHSPMLLMLAAAVMKLLALENVAVCRSVLLELDVAAGNGAPTS